MRNSKLSFVCLLCGMLLNFAVLLAHAEEQISEEVWQKKAAEMYQQVLSPFCPGRSLNDCPSSKAQELKTDMLVKLQSGVAEQEVLEGVFAKFGDQYRAIPKGEGFGRLVWLAPGLFVLLGLALAYYMSTRREILVPSSKQPVLIKYGAFRPDFRVKSPNLRAPLETKKSITSDFL